MSSVDPNPYSPPQEKTLASSAEPKPPSRVWFRLGLVIIAVGFVIIGVSFLLPTTIGFDFIGVNLMVASIGAATIVLGFFWSVLFTIVFMIRWLHYTQRYRGRRRDVV